MKTILLLFLFLIFLSQAFGQDYSWGRSGFFNVSIGYVARVRLDSDYEYNGHEMNSGAASFHLSLPSKFILEDMPPVINVMANLDLGLLSYGQWENAPEQFYFDLDVGPSLMLGYYESQEGMGTGLELGPIAGFKCQGVPTGEIKDEYKNTDACSLTAGVQGILHLVFLDINVGADILSTGDNNNSFEMGVSFDLSGPISDLKIINDASRNQSKDLPRENSPAKEKEHDIQTV